MSELKPHNLLAFYEKQIGKRIPKVEDLKNKHLGYVSFNDKITELKIDGEFCEEHGGSMLQTLNDNFSEFDSIEVLILQRNRLKTLPPNIGSLKSLKILCLDENRISSIPYNICSLSSLEILSLNQNELKFVPDCISKLPSLKYLDVSANFLTSLPENITKLKSLKTLKSDFLISLDPDYQ
ncbi:MAG: hypothetical protein GF364_01455 [Candidatus Lokiarchaeota archaeon]|nr:hypothetical protein [Candidatus Lokiarchaeota archaeon]